MIQRALRITCLATALFLVACSTPFSDKLTEIDWSGKPAPGTITISEPKGYQRASLINERRLEAEWLNDLLNKSQIAEFTPEIVREIEQITVFAGALGLSFDPTSAVNYKKASETGSIEQQIDVMKLQLQLDQLKRDAELVRKGFDAQSAPVNTDLNKLGGPSASTASPSNAAAADQLNAAITRLSASVTNRIDADAKAPSLSKTAPNPSDTFRDRSAYRDLIKAARNSNSLDDLHDFGGSALIRLNFQASVLPDRLHSKVPGVVQMTIKEPILTSADHARIYEGWLEHINQGLNVFDGIQWQPNSDLLLSAAADNFDVIEYRYDIPPATAPPPSPVATIGRKQVFSKAPPLQSSIATGATNASKCRGLLIKGMGNGGGNCGTLIFAVPQFAGSSGQEYAYTGVEDLLAFFGQQQQGGDLKGFTDEQTDVTDYKNLQTYLVANPKTLIRDCKLIDSPTAGNPGEPTPIDKLSHGIKKSQIRVAVGSELAKVERAAQRILAQRNIKTPRSDSLIQLIYKRAARAKRFLSNVQLTSFQGCPNEKINTLSESVQQAYVPVGFTNALTGGKRVVVYDIGPREQVQQVSSVSRVANNFAMAVAIAASAPNSGAAARAAAEYSRQATGKAATIERLPGLVGYSRTNGIFGWVIGPRATFDPKGNIRLEHTLKSVDLSVDLSIPSWWPRFTIEATTGWAPTAESITNGSIDIVSKRTAYSTPVTVPMAMNYADYEVLSARIKLGGLAENRQVSLDEENLQNQTLSACRKTNLFIRGVNMWRATNVLIGGHLLDETAITVAPDMSGIFLAVPPLDELIGDVAGPKIGLSVFTRYHEATGTIDYSRKPTPAGCKPADDNNAPADGPAITAFAPTQFQAGTEMWFTIEGSKLDKVTGVTINAGQSGELFPSAKKDGKIMYVKFSPNQTSSLPVSRTVPLAFYKDSKKVAEKLVEVTANRGVK